MHPLHALFRALRSFGNSFAFTENNVMGTHVIVETAKTCGIKRFIHVSTDEARRSQRLALGAVSPQ